MMQRLFGTKVEKLTVFRHIPTRQIYMPDRNDHSEEQMLKKYVRTHLRGVDVNTLTEKEKSEIIEKAKQSRAQDLSVINPHKIRDIFDKMTEIDTMPGSKSSKDFERKMGEIERKKQNKGQGIVTIKTMKKGKVRKVESQKYQTDSAGRI